MYERPNWSKFEQAFGLKTHAVSAQDVLNKMRESGLTYRTNTNYEARSAMAAECAKEAARKRALEHIKQLQELHSAKVAASTYQEYMAARRALSELRTIGTILPLKGIDMNPQQAYSAQQVPPTPVGPVVYRYTNKMHPNYKAQGQVVFKAPADNLHKSGRTTGRILVALGTAIQQGAAVMYDHQNGYTNMHDLAALVLSTAAALGLRYIECRPQQSLGRVAIRCEILDAT